METSMITYIFLRGWAGERKRSECRRRMEKANVNFKDLMPTKLQPCKHLVANATGGASYILGFLLVVFLSNIAHALLRTFQQPRMVAETLVSFPLSKQEIFYMYPSMVLGIQRCFISMHGLFEFIQFIAIICRCTKLLSFFLLT